jgi:hypothetical protein
VQSLEIARLVLLILRRKVASISHGIRGALLVPPAVASALPQRRHIRRDIAGLVAGQIHVRHLGVRVEEERHQAIFIEVRPFSDFLEWRGVGVRLALGAGDHMAGRAPALRQSFTLGR